LLQRIAQTQGKSLELVGFTHPYLGLDAVAPHGINELKGPTGILIQHKASFSDSYVKKLMASLQGTVSRLSLGSICFVFSGKISKTSKSIREVVEEFRSWGLEVSILDYNSLSALVDKHQDFVNEIMPRLSVIHLETIAAPRVQDPPEDWKERRNRHVDSLRSRYRDNNLTFFLGAGVSVDAGVPTWNQLLNDLFADFVSKRVLSCGEQAQNVALPQQPIERKQPALGLSAASLPRCSVT